MAWLVRWFETGGFTCSLDAPDGDGTNNLEVIGDFLDRRSDYSIHYATSLAVPGRARGVPTRVAIGHQSAETSGDGARVTSNRYLHAWCEAYIQGIDWLMFDTAPGVDSGSAEIPAGTEATTSAAAETAANSTETTNTPQVDASTTQETPEMGATPAVETDDSADATTAGTAGADDAFAPLEPVLGLLRAHAWAARVRDACAGHLRRALRRLHGHAAFARPTPRDPRPSPHGPAQEIAGPPLSNERHPPRRPNQEASIPPLAPPPTGTSRPHVLKVLLDNPALGESALSRPNGADRMCGSGPPTPPPTGGHQPKEPRSWRAAIVPAPTTQHLTRSVPRPRDRQPGKLASPC